MSLVSYLICRKMKMKIEGNEFQYIIKEIENEFYKVSWKDLGWIGEELSKNYARTIEGIETRFSSSVKKASVIIRIETNACTFIELLFWTVSDCSVLSSPNECTHTSAHTSELMQRLMQCQKSALMNART